MMAEFRTEVICGKKERGGGNNLEGQAEGFWGTVTISLEGKKKHLWVEKW